MNVHGHVALDDQRVGVERRPSDPGEPCCFVLWGAGECRWSLPGSPWTALRVIRGISGAKSCPTWGVTSRS
jgi:hypothetical protein